MQAGSLRQIGRALRVKPVPVDGLRPGQCIEFVVRAGGIKDAEAHAADVGKRFAGSTGCGTVELRLGHRALLSLVRWVGSSTFTMACCDRQLG
jgi:hypothetical protein